MGALKDFLPYYTYEDYKHWEGKWELINGIPFAMSPSPNFYHQRISSKIAWILESQFSECPDCLSLISFDFKVGEDIVLQPDNLVICEKPENINFLTKPPILIFEIVSPETLKKDTLIKFEIYEKQRVKYYVIIFPEDKKVKIYKISSNNKYELVDEFKDKIFEFDLEKCKIKFDFSKIW